jgi:hypothetical protein
MKYRLASASSHCRRSGIAGNRRSSERRIEAKDVAQLRRRRLQAAGHEVGRHAVLRPRRAKKQHVDAWMLLEHRELRESAVRCRLDEGRVAPFEGLQRGEDQEKSGGEPDQSPDGLRPVEYPRRHGAQNTGNNGMSRGARVPIRRFALG